MAGAVDDYDAQMLGAIVADLAAELSIDPSEVSIELQAGSVVLRLQLPASAAAALERKVGSGELTALGGVAILAAGPTTAPTRLATASPTTPSPSKSPTARPSGSPTAEPTRTPTERPSLIPTGTN